MKAKSSAECAGDFVFGAVDERKETTGTAYS